ncbi:hypothetical protein HPB52_017807 [Rhipicephalus sanguineus]|uniref:Uncharacterized protein n=1 Tax=Rhipicephalus sanguineus TaxID=34632 RepID=A0A9D4Q6U9_RHISA|nr:hypothetical protein HPB52_017807 [Rhipicephalus sanguineus]
MSQAPLLSLLLLGLLLIVPASRASEPVDPMDAYLRAQPPEPTRPKAARGRGFAAAESISTASRKLQLPESQDKNTDDLPYGARLKPPRLYGVTVAAPPTTTTRLAEATRPTTTVRPRVSVRPPPTAPARTTAVRGGPQRRRLVPDDIIGLKKKLRTTQQTPRPTIPPSSVPQQAKFRTPSKVTLATPRPTASPKIKGALRSRKPFGGAKGGPLKVTLPPESKNGTRAAVNESSGNGTTHGPKAQASFFFTNVGPNHFEYRGVFDQNAVPISFRDNPETLFQLIPQLPRLFEDPFSAPKGPAAQLLLHPPPKLTEPPAPPPPPPLTLLQPVVNFIEDPVPPPTAVVEHVPPPPPPPPPPPAPRPQARLPPGGFPKYDYIRGPQYPKIFKFNDERISILEFERIKREGRLTRRRGDALDPDRVSRNNFLIFHGGLFKSPREQEYGNLVAPPPPRSEPVYAPYKALEPTSPDPPPATRFHFLPLKPTFAKGKPGGFVYFIRT